MILSRLKRLLWEEYLPICIFVSLDLIRSQIVLIWPLILYSLFKWPRAIFVYAGYYLWIRYDSINLKTEGRKFIWLKYMKVFNCIRDYFPMRLIKTAELPPGNNYILAFFPHGVDPWGLMFNFLTNMNNVEELFAGFDIRVAMISVIFSYPVSREIFMALGACTPDENNLKYLLSTKMSRIIAMSPGGIKELTYSVPGSEYTIVKNDRKGFVRIALHTGSALVPVFSFGENKNLTQKMYNSWFLWRYLSDIFHKLCRLRLVMVWGRGNFNFGPIYVPYKRPITTVVGCAIKLPKVENPPDALIDEYHEIFYQALNELFEKNKHKFDEAGENATLKMI